MNSLFVIALITSLSLAAGVSTAQTLWTGPQITITKANFADWTLPENQDSLTANVILIRANGDGVFYIAQESEFVIN